MKTLLKNNEKLPLQFHAIRETRVPRHDSFSLNQRGERSNRIDSIQRMAMDSQATGRLMQFQTMADQWNSKRPIQFEKNRNNFPDHLKSGIETLSGISMDHVKVHKNSNKPALLQAHAYTQGSNIFLGPGQEKHLAHEAWHAVQQKQGKVKPTVQFKDTLINNDTFLEKEADKMGAKSLDLVQRVPDNTQTQRKVRQSSQKEKGLVQRMRKRVWGNNNNKDDSDSVEKKLSLAEIMASQQSLSDSKKEKEGAKSAGSSNWADIAKTKKSPPSDKVSSNNSISSSNNGEKVKKMLDRVRLWQRKKDDGSNINMSVKDLVELLCSLEHIRSKSGANSVFYVSIGEGEGKYNGAVVVKVVAKFANDVWQATNHKPTYHFCIKNLDKIPMELEEWKRD